MGAGKDLWNQYEVLDNKLDYEGLSSLYASDAVFIDSNGRHEGREAILANLKAAHRPFSDLRMETVLLVEEGDTVAGEWLWHATHSGPLPVPDGGEIPATGKAVELPGLSIFTLRDGKFATHRDYFDNLALMSQLGLLPGA